MVNIDVAKWSEYELLDSGNGRKLERFGKYTLNRIETQALWKQSLSQDVWHKADAIFRKTDDPFDSGSQSSPSLRAGRHGEWEFKNNIPQKWAMPYENLNLELRLTSFGHVGVFPDQSSQWGWIRQKIEGAGRPISALNLFTYTGAATLACAAAGASVVHVDASKPAITWARDNQKLSKLTDKPVRWIPEDALKFVKRELRRENRYDVIIMDPPKFGRGPQGEVWKFEESFPELLDYCRQLLSKQPLFILVTAYAVPMSSITLSNMMGDMLRKHKGMIEYGELGLAQTSNERILPTAIYTRWES